MKNSMISSEFGTALKLFLLSTILFLNSCEETGSSNVEFIQQNDIEDVVAENVTAFSDILGEAVKTAMQTPNLFVNLKDNEVLIRSTDCAHISVEDKVEYPKSAWIDFNPCLRDDKNKNAYGGVLDVKCHVPLGKINADGPEFSLFTGSLSINENLLITDGPIQFNFLSMEGNSICYTYELSADVTTYTANGVSETYFPEGMTGIKCINLARGANPTSLAGLLSSLEDIKLKIDPVKVCCSNDRGATRMCSLIDSNDGFISCGLGCGCPDTGVINIYGDGNDNEVCDCEDGEEVQICNVQQQGQGGTVYSNITVSCASAKKHLQDNDGDYCGPCNSNGRVAKIVNFGAGEHGRITEGCDEYVSIGEEVMKLTSCNIH